jgi:ribonuclease J
MHGEHRHLREHVKLAGAKGISSILAVNGMMVDLTHEQPGVAEFVETGRTYLDGTARIGALDGVIRDRIRMALNGLVVVTLITEDDEALGDPWVDLKGLPETGESNAALSEVLEEDLSQLIGRAKRKLLADDDALEKEISRVVRQTAQAEIGKKPEVVVIISRLG